MDRKIYAYVRNDEYCGAFNERCGFRADAVGEELQISVDGVIGSEWDGLTSTDLVPQIKQHDGPIRFLFNSPGGLVFDAVAVYYAAVEHPHPVYGDILGQAASAATIIASAADELRIGGMGRYHIHQAWTGYLVSGNSREMRNSLAWQEQVWGQLEQIDNTLIDVLSDRSGLEVDAVRELISAEPDGTVYTGQEAVDAGFVDAMIPNKKKAAEPPSEVPEGYATGPIKNRLRILSTIQANLTAAQR